MSHARLETRENSVMPSENGFSTIRNTRDASSNPFLNLANYSHTSAPWTTQTSIRHANIVSFSFRVLLLPNFRDGAHVRRNTTLIDIHSRARSSGLLKSLQQSSYSVLLKRRHIWQLAKDWTGEEEMSLHDASSATNSDEVITAIFFFRTICQSHSWQIEREVRCIMSTSTGTDVEPHPDERFLQNQYSQIRTALAQVRNIFGKESVEYALRRCSLILRHSEDEGQVQWAPPSNQEKASVEQYLALFDSATTDSETSRLYHRHSVGLLHVLGAGEMTEVPPFLPIIPELAGKGGAMLAVRQSSWPAECPRFCLFVLPENEIDNKAQLARLLHDAIEDKNFYSADSEPKWAEADWKLLRAWEALLTHEAEDGMEFTS